MFDASETEERDTFEHARGLQKVAFSDNVSCARSEVVRVATADTHPHCT